MPFPARRLLRQIFQVRRHAVFSMDSPDTLRPQETRIPVNLVPVEEANVGRAAAFWRDREVDKFRRFLSEDQLGVYALSDDTLVGHAWALVCRQPKRLGCGYFPLTEGQALIHYCHVSEEARGKNIYPAMLVHLVRRLFDEARVHTVFIDTESINQPSIRGIEKVGFAPLGTGVYVQLFKRGVYARLDPMQD